MPRTHDRQRAGVTLPIKGPRGGRRGIATEAMVRVFANYRTFPGPCVSEGWKRENRQALERRRVPVENDGAAGISSTSGRRPADAYASGRFNVPRVSQLKAWARKISLSSTFTKFLTPAKGRNIKGFTMYVRAIALIFRWLLPRTTDASSGKISSTRGIAGSTECLLRMSEPARQACSLSRSLVERSQIQAL